MDQNIKTNYNGIVKSGRYSCIRKQRTLKAYGEEYPIPVKTAEFSERLRSAIADIAKTVNTDIYDTVRKIKNGIALFIGGEEAERIFPDDNLGQIDIEEILGFWLALNYEFGCSQDSMLDEYAASGVIR